MEQPMHNISTPPIIQNVSRLETIAEEELTYPDLSEESLAEDVPKRLTRRRRKRLRPS